MSTSVPAAAAVPAHLLAAYEQLADSEKAVFLRRYVCSETMEQTCLALKLQPERYKELINSCLRQMRKSPRPVAADQYVPEPA